MTTTSIAAGFAAALFCSLLFGRSLRGFRAGHAVAIAISIAAGLILLQSSSPQDVLRFVQPKVALDWLPLVCLLASGVISIPSGKFRVTLGIVLALLIPGRFLWGSVYLQPGELEARTLMSLAIWSMALAAPMVLPDSELATRKSWRTAVWIFATAVTGILIAGSGSLTYGAAAGVCGLVMLGFLLSASQISNLAAVPLISLIGLSASFAELPNLIAGLMLLAWIGVLAGDQIKGPRLIAVTRIGATCVLLAAVTMTVVRVIDDSGSSATLNSGYGSMNESSAAKLNEKKSLTTPLSESANTLSQNASPKSPSPITSEDSADPFAGIDAE
ncbi:MAG: hypothetical protein U0936_02275 [Planctomycetaceae bacterium]